MDEKRAFARKASIGKQKKATYSKGY